jgi:hypothetical protein
MKNLLKKCDGKRTLKESKNEDVSEGNMKCYLFLTELRNKAAVSIVRIIGELLQFQ